MLCSVSETMLRQRCVQITISVALFVIRLLGYFPFYLDKESGQFRSNWLLKMYPAVFVFSLSAALNWIFSNFFDDIRSNTFTETANMVIEIYSLANVMLLLFNYLFQYFNFSLLFRAANDAITAIKCTNLTYQLINWKSLNKFWLKCIFIAIYSFTINDIRIARLSNNAKAQYFCLFVVNVGLYAMEIIANLHYALLLITSLTFDVINKKLIEIMDDAHRLDKKYLELKDTTNPMQHFCDLSDRLDRVAEMHYRCSLVSVQLQNMFSGAVTVWTINKQATLVTHLFMMYITTNQWTMFRTDRVAVKYPTEMLSYGFMMSGMLCWELFVLAKECTLAANEVSTFICIYAHFPYLINW